MKKGQTEIIGLLIIVLIIIFSLMFYFRIMLYKEPLTTKSSYQNVFASNTLSVILNYKPSPTCHERKIIDLLENCEISCIEVVSACSCPCEYSKIVIEDILSSLMEEGDFSDYYFTAKKAGSDFIEIGADCGVGITSPTYRFGGYSFDLKLCK